MRSSVLVMSLAACSSGSQVPQPTPPAAAAPADAAVIAVVAVDAAPIAPDASTIADNLVDVPIINEQSNHPLELGGGAGVGGAAGAPARNRDNSVVGSVSITALRSSNDSTLRVVRARMGIYRACYQRALNHNGGLAGRIAMSLEIGADGVVNKVVKTDHSMQGDDDVIACLIANLKRLKFPDNDPRTPVYAFDFSSTPRPGY